MRLIVIYELICFPNQSMVLKEVKRKIWTWNWQIYVPKCHNWLSSAHLSNKLKVKTVLIFATTETQAITDYQTYLSRGEARWCMFLRSYCGRILEKTHVFHFVTTKTSLQFIWDTGLVFYKDRSRIHRHL